MQAGRKRPSGLSIDLDLCIQHHSNFFGYVYGHLGKGLDLDLINIVIWLSCRFDAQAV
jgi:hypothetical protein